MQQWYSMRLWNPSYCICTYKYQQAFLAPLPGKQLAERFLKTYRQLQQDYLCSIELRNRQDNRCHFNLSASFHKKRRNIEELRVLEHSRSINTRTLPSHRFVWTYIFSNHVQIGGKGQRHKNSNHISSDKNKCCTTHKFHLVSHGEFDQER